MRTYAYVRGFIIKACRTLINPALIQMKNVKSNVYVNDERHSMSLIVLRMRLQHVGQLFIQIWRVCENKRRVK